mmetsp:Transcript_98186/g.305680  ORF Transcript_98186/g.305680 Transcript_98186/m.305680 type:complete len:201 (-) Transcript_98186:199-801(-)
MRHPRGGLVQAMCLPSKGHRLTKTEWLTQRGALPHVPSRRGMRTYIGPASGGAEGPLGSSYSRLCAGCGTHAGEHNAQAVAHHSGLGASRPRGHHIPAADSAAGKVAQGPPQGRRRSPAGLVPAAAAGEPVAAWATAGKNAGMGAESSHAVPGAREAMSRSYSTAYSCASPESATLAVQAERLSGVSTVLLMLAGETFCH